MRRKRTRAAPAPTPDEGKPPDATGLTIDWIGVQATGSGGPGLLGSWVVVGLTAVRAAPFLAWKAARRLRGRAAPASSSGSGEGSGSGGASPPRDLSDGDR